MQDVLAGRKPQDELSERARAICQFESHLDTLLCEQDRGAIGRYSWISHLVSSGCELAVQAWWRYRYTGNARRLHEAYPLLRGAVEKIGGVVAHGNLRRDRPGACPQGPRQ